MAETVIITGGSGFLAQHLIAYLQNHAVPICTEIRTIDTVPFCKFIEYPEKICIKNYVFDLCYEDDELNAVFQSATTVFHCAGRHFEYLHTEEDPTEQYHHGNTEACEGLIKRMVANSVKRLVFVGDAYANLPNGDNYGLSEEMHLGVPSSYILDGYGETKTKGELIARKAANDGMISAIFLRPTIIYGEGEKNLVGSFLKFCKFNGGCLDISGDDRGNHQYIYAGNMAAAMYRSMECLRTDAEKYNGEIVFCMDTTVCTPFKKFIKSFMETFGVKQNAETSYMSAFISSVYYEMLYKLGFLDAQSRLSFTAQRFLFGWSVGFPNRKLRLLLDFVPPVDQKEAIEKTLLWYKGNQMEWMKTIPYKV